MVRIVRVASKADQKRFVDFPYVLNAGDPQWVPPLRIERREVLDPRKNSFFEHGEAQLFLCERDGRVVGRISAQTNRLHNERYGDFVGFFGFFDAVNDPEVARSLFDAAREWLRSRGMRRIRGPFNFTINDEAGILVDGFDTAPYILMTHNLPYYDALVRSAGRLEKVKDLYAWEYDVSRPIPAKVLEVSQMVGQLRDLKVRPLDKKRMLDEVHVVMSIFNEAWGDNWGFIPMTEAALAKMAAELKLLLEPELTLVAEWKGEPVAIAVVLPDLNAVIRDLRGRLLPFGLAKLMYRMLFDKPKRGRLILLGLRRAARGGELWGLSLHLYARLHEAAKRLGYRHAELSWTLEDNHKINRGIERMGGRIYKTYRIYEGDV